MKRAAVIDDTGNYRYSLTREWDATKPKVVFVMLNGSTADVDNDDPTLRRCIGFAKRWGFGSLEVVNLFGYRTTFPNELKAVANPYGIENDRYLWQAIKSADKVIIAWGVNGTYLQRDREVLKMLAEKNIRVYCLGKTKDGIPKHPLYLKNGTIPSIFTMDYKNMSLTELNKVVADIRQNDPDNWGKLSAKCNWEQMIPAKVLQEYGHPKDW